MKNWGGHFTPESGGHFELESGGHFKLELGGQYHRNMHINTVAKDYYQDESFCRNANGDISMWEFYNLLTGSNKTSYIDTFLERGVNAFDFSKGISKALSDRNSAYSWFLS